MGDGTGPVRGTCEDLPGTFWLEKIYAICLAKNLCREGIFQNENAVVTSQMSQEEYLEQESTAIVNNRFEGSLSKFVTAFTGRKKLSDRQIQELRQIIDENTK